MNDMNSLMLHFLQDIYYAEKLGIRSMAKLIRAVENEELKKALQDHREQSQTQVERLVQVFAALGKRPRAKTCAAMDGLVEEGTEAIHEGDKGPVLDSALIACQQAAEHYEIARYGAMAAWAHSLGLEEAAEILEEILQEEKEADAHLNDIALHLLNPEMADIGGEEAADDEEDEDEAVEMAEHEVEIEVEEEEEEEEEPVPERIEEAAPPRPRRRSPSRAKK